MSVVPRRRETDGEDLDFSFARKKNGHLDPNKVLMIVGFGVLPFVFAGLVLFYGYDRANTQSRIDAIERKAEAANTAVQSVAQLQAVQSATAALQFAEIQKALGRIENELHSRDGAASGRRN